MKRVWLWGILLAFQLGFAQDKIPFINYDSVIEKASAKKETGDVKEMIEELNKLSKNDSTYPSILVERSYYHLQLQEYDKVIELCNEGLNSDMKENRGSFFINKVASYSRSEQYDKALEVIEEGLKEFPKNQKLWYNKAHIYESMGKTEEAIALYQKVILLNPYYRTPHLKLGNLAYKQQKMAQALMCFNMYIMLEPDAEGTASLLKQLNGLASGKNVNEPSTEIVLSTDDSAFEEIDMILNQKVALNESYDIGNEIDMALMKQSHALFTTLLDFEGNDGFWDRKYAPFYQWVMNEGHFNDYAYTLAYSTENEEYQKVIGKKTDEIVAFLGLAQNKWVEIVQKNQAEEGPEEKFLTNYYKDEYLRGVGEEVNGNYVGVWKFYDSYGRPSAIGSFDPEGKRHGKWTWYFGNDRVKETVTYNHGVLDGPYHSFHENGKKRIVAQYKSDNLEGEYKLYNNKGALEQKKHFKQGKLDGRFQSNFSIGEDILEYDILYKEGIIQGTVKEYHITGELYEETPYVNGEIQGVQKQYNSEGTLLKEVNYVNGQLDGYYRSYHYNGKPYEVGQCLAGNYEGAWKSYNENGTLAREFNYEKGKLQGIGNHYDEEGRLHLEYTYRKGEIIAYKVFGKDGALLNEAKKKGGEFLYKAFNGYGDLASEGLYDISGGKKGTWKFYDENGQIESNGFYEEDQLQGIYTAYFNNGNVQSVSQYEKGSLEGYYVDYYQNGTMRTQGWYRDSEALGEWRSYYKDGTLQALNYYHKGNFHGEQIYYAVDGSKYEVYKYVHGEPLFEKSYRPDGTVFETIDYTNAEGAGKWTYHHFNGKPKLEVSYKNGIKHGSYVRYNYYGNKTMEGQHVGGVQHGLWTWYHDNESVRAKVDFHIDQYHGNSMSYYENGTFKDKFGYRFGVEDGTWSSYFEDGTLMIKSERKNGKYHGRVEFYSSNGKLQVVEFYEHDRILGYSYHDKDGNEVPMIPLENETGKVVSYYDNGQIAREYEYINENLNGKAVAYNYDGSYQHIRNFVDDENEGKCTYYYSNGNLKRETEYLNGAKHGKEVLYHENKKIKEESQYLNDSKHGVSKYYDENGKMIKKEVFFNGDIYESERF